MKYRVNDPDQPFDHEGNPEDGPERFFDLHECECGRLFDPVQRTCCSTCRSLFWREIDQLKRDDLKVAA